MTTDIVRAPHGAEPSALYVPDIPEDVDPIRGALLWADAGWYIGPLDPDRGKHAGSALGKQWQHQTSRDPQVIAGWFAGTDLQPFVHCGRSGAIAFDLDTPEAVSDPLRRAVLECRPPIHTTRRIDGDPVAAFERFEARGHVLFLQPPGRMIGNGNGRLGKAWGDVRGKNGIIVVDPARHSKPDGLYRVRRSGSVPALPGYVAELLDDSNSVENVATDAEVAAAAARWTGNARPAALEAVLRRWDTDVRSAGASRHVTLVALACWIAREARAGVYPLGAGIAALRDRWTHDTTLPLGGGRIVAPSEAASEFANGIAWGVAQALAADRGRIDALRAKHATLTALETAPADGRPTGSWADLWS